MKTKFNGILTLLLAFVVQISFAQERTISGTVSDETGPLPGVGIMKKGTTQGTETDFDGNYSIKAKAGDILIFSFVGMKTIEKTVGLSGRIDATMSSENVLEEVVITAQGIKREKKALGYAVSEVKSNDIEQRTEGDVARVLSGKASGVQITSQSGTSGSGTNVVIRGYNSINGSNQALFVVDGVPFSSDTNTSSDQDGYLEGNVGASRFLDLDPNNIESVNVLKGLAAATLYGSAGRNGVIVITTKSGAAGAAKKKTEITVNQSYFVNEIASIPDYQNKYGGGFNQSFGWFYSNWGPSFDENGIAGYLNDPATRLPSNPRKEFGIQPDGTILHPYHTSGFLNGPNANKGDNILRQQFNNVRYEWKPYNSVENFFRKGGISNTSLNIRGASSKGDISYNLNYGHLDETGFTPGNSITRNTLSVGGVAKLNNKFTVNATLNYSRNDVKSPPVAASRGNGSLGLSAFANVFFTPRNVDLMGLPYQIPETGGSIYYRNGNDIINPRWIVANSGSKQLTNRMFGTASLAYNFNENLNLTYRAGIDFYNERNTAFSNKNGVSFQQAILGYYETWDNNVRIWDHFLALGGDYELTDDIGMTFNVGATSRSRLFDRKGLSSSQQISFGVLRHSNFKTQSSRFFVSDLPIEYTEGRNIIGTFGEASFDYKNYLFLTLSARNDWVSNLPMKNNSKFYPSVSASFIPTAAFENLKSENGLNYLKLRAGLGQSAGFPTRYPSYQAVEQSTTANGGADGGIITNQVSSVKANPDLKPELLSEFEIGFDSRFFKNRVNLNLSYYTRTTEDLIVDKSLPASTGFLTQQDNVGKIEGDGWEVDLGVDILKNPESFNWNSRVNFTTSKQIVVEQDEDQIIFAGSRTNAAYGGNAAIKGEQLGVIVGTRIERDSNGNLVVNAAGNYKSQSQVKLEDGRTITPIIGNPNPDYVMNFINSFSYKNWNLNFQLSHTKGGDVASATIATLLGRGLIKETEDRENTFILPGVVEKTGLPNQQQINNSQYYFSNVLFGPKELQIYDASVIRLQEVSLSYSLPKDVLSKTPFGNVTLTASGFNLWYNAYNTPDGANFDPNVAGVGVGNGRGFDYLNGPSSRRYGLSVKLSF